MPFERAKEYLRILKLARKPSREEFSRVAKISGAGMLIVGAIGFLMYLAMVVMPGRFR
jgi:protein transport protein SEC61 subunit gamma-like protein